MFNYSPNIFVKGCVCDGLINAHISTRKKLCVMITIFAHDQQNRTIMQQHMS